VVRSIQELPGQDLFQYVDDAGEVRTVRSMDVNDYLREIAGAEVSAKDFRTWAGTVLAVLALGAIGPFSSQSEARMNVRRAIEGVAARLGNTATICRKCYIHPHVVLCYLEGCLPVSVLATTTLPAPACRARRPPCCAFLPDALLAGHRNAPRAAGCFGPPGHKPLGHRRNWAAVAPLCPKSELPKE
jgi:DNA topoisomerase I